jgi:hypothetical protein
MRRSIGVAAVLSLASCTSGGDQVSERPQVPATTVTSAAAQEGTRGQDGDTVMLFVHHVKASKRAEYERWFSNVWAPALRAVSEKRESARRLNLAERDLRPTEPTAGGDYVYAYLYDPWVTDTGGPSGGFPESILKDAGRSAADAKKQAEAFRSFITKTEGHMFVQKQF